jgi:putative SOS response-associated peptidase YedK
MCTNYRPSAIEAMKFGTLEDIRETKIPFKVEVFPNDPAPIIRPARADSENAGHLEWTPARFGLVPFWAKDDQVAKLGRMAYNARTETVAEKPMFRQAWSRAQFCLVPAELFYETNWESGSAVRWRIEMASREPFAMGGLWESHGKGETYFESFTMLTINADAHPVMNQFHRPGDEKRMPVIIEPENYLAWLNATPLDAVKLLKPFPPELMTSRPEPMPPRTKREKPQPKKEFAPMPTTEDLF